MQNKLPHCLRGMKEWGTALETGDRLYSVLIHSDYVMQLGER